MGDFVDEFEGFVVEEGEGGVCARDTAYVSPGDFALVFPAGGVGVDEEDVPGGKKLKELVEEEGNKRKKEKKRKNIPAITHMLTANEPRRSIRRNCGRFLKNGLHSEIRRDHILGKRANFDFIELAILSCPLLKQEMLLADFTCCDDFGKVTDEGFPFRSRGQWKQVSFVELLLDVVEGEVEDPGDGTEAEELEAHGELGEGETHLREEESISDGDDI